MKPVTSPEREGADPVPWDLAIALALFVGLFLAVIVIGGCVYHAHASAALTSTHQKDTP